MDSCISRCRGSHCICFWSNLLSPWHRFGATLVACTHVQGSIAVCFQGRSLADIRGSHCRRTGQLRNWSLWEERPDCSARRTWARSSYLTRKIRWPGRRATATSPCRATAGSPSTECPGELLYLSRNLFHFEFDQRYQSREKGKESRYWSRSNLGLSVESRTKRAFDRVDRTRKSSNFHEEKIDREGRKLQMEERVCWTRWRGIRPLIKRHSHRSVSRLVPEQERRNSALILGEYRAFEEGKHACLSSAGIVYVPRSAPGRSVANERRVMKYPWSLSPEVRISRVCEKRSPGQWSSRGIGARPKSNIGISRVWITFRDVTIFFFFFLERIRRQRGNSNSVKYRPSRRVTPPLAVCGFRRCKCFRWQPAVSRINFETANKQWMVHSTR